MEKEQLKEFLGNMWCALNCANTNGKVMEIMNLMDKFGGNSTLVWQDYTRKKKDMFRTSIKRMKYLLTSSQSN